MYAPEARWRKEARDVFVSLRVESIALGDFLWFRRQMERGLWGVIELLRFYRYEHSRGLLIMIPHNFTHFLNFMLDINLSYCICIELCIYSVEYLIHINTNT